MHAPEAALHTVKDNLRGRTVAILTDRLPSLSREVEQTRRRCKKQEKVLEETRRDLLATVLTPDHYEALLFVHSQLEGCSRYVSTVADGGAICNGVELASRLLACADATDRLLDAFMAIGVTMPDSPPTLERIIESSPEDEIRPDDDVLAHELWELSAHFKDQTITDLRRRVARLTRELECAKRRLAKLDEAVAVLQNTPLLTHDKCHILQRIYQRTRYLARRCQDAPAVPVSEVVEELKLYAQGVRQITNTFLVVLGAMALPPQTQINRETWACASDFSPVAVQAH